MAASSLNIDPFHQARSHEAELAKTRCKERIIRISAMINEKISEWVPSGVTFSVSPQAQERILSNTVACVHRWQGGKKQLHVGKDWQKIHKTVRSWWNKHKAMHLGNTLFGPLIFVHFFKFVEESTGLNQNDKLAFFIDTLEGLCTATIRFTHTRQHPLIPTQTFSSSNHFSDRCLNFVSKFDEQWNRNKAKASPVDDFIRCLQAVKEYSQAFVQELEKLRANAQNESRVPLAPPNSPNMEMDVDMNMNMSANNPITQQPLIEDTQMFPGNDYGQSKEQSLTPWCSAWTDSSPAFDTPFEPATTTPFDFATTTPFNSRATTPFDFNFSSADSVWDPLDSMQPCFTPCNDFEMRDTSDDFW